MNLKRIEKEFIEELCRAISFCENSNIMLNQNYCNPYVDPTKIVIAFRQAIKQVVESVPVVEEIKQWKKKILDDLLKEDK